MASLITKSIDTLDQDAFPLLMRIEQRHKKGRASVEKHKPSMLTRVSCSWIGCDQRPRPWWSRCLCRPPHGSRGQSRRWRSPRQVEAPPWRRRSRASQRRQPMPCCTLAHAEPIASQSHGSLPTPHLCRSSQSLGRSTWKARIKYPEQR